MQINSLNKQTTHNAPPAGMPGRRLIAIVLVLLTIIAATLSYTLWCYSQFDAARAKTAVAWRDLAEELSRRYTAISAEPTLAAGIDSPEFAQALDRFQTTVQTAAQCEAAREVERQLTPFAASLPAPSESLRQALSGFNGAREREADILNQPGGRLLSLFLSFPQPIPFELTTP